MILEFPEVQSYVASGLEFHTIFKDELHSHPRMCWDLDWSANDYRIKTYPWVIFSKRIYADDFSFRLMHGIFDSESKRKPKLETQYLFQFCATHSLSELRHIPTSTLKTKFQYLLSKPFPPNCMSLSEATITM